MSNTIDQSKRFEQMQSFTYQRICQHCFVNENGDGSIQLNPPCKHRFVDRHAWIAIDTMTLFGLRSEDRARVCFSERGADYDDFVAIRRLSEVELAELAAGRLRAAIVLIPSGAKPEKEEYATSKSNRNTG